MSSAADELRLRFEDFITEQRRLARAVAGDERVPDQLVQAQQLLEVARDLLARADGVLQSDVELDDTVEAEAAFTCLALLVPEVLTSVGYKDPPPPTFADILSDLEEARDHLVRPGSDEARVDALRSLDDIITLVERAADAVLASRPPGLWKIRLDGAIRVSRALIPHVATTTAIVLASGVTGGQFAAAVSTVGTSLAALLLPTSKDLRELFEPPDQHLLLAAEHRRAVRAALDERDRLLAKSTGRNSVHFRWAEQAQATARLHLRMLSNIPGEDTTQLDAAVAEFGRPRRLRRRQTVRCDEPPPAVGRNAAEDEQPRAPDNSALHRRPRDPRPGGTGIGGL
ncbi:hypothetical protein [Streptomyces sp. NPDC002386]